MKYYLGQKVPGDPPDNKQRAAGHLYSARFLHRATVPVCRRAGSARNASAEAGVLHWTGFLPVPFEQLSVR